MIEATVEELTPIIGTRPACRALGASPATIYRRRRPPEPRPKKPRSRPARALSEAEREAVLARLHDERFVDSSPAAVWATLLDEGRYLCSERTMSLTGTVDHVKAVYVGALVRFDVVGGQELHIRPAQFELKRVPVDICHLLRCPVAVPGLL